MKMNKGLISGILQEMPASLRLMVGIMFISIIVFVGLFVISLSPNCASEIKEIALIGMNQSFFFMVALIGICLKEFWGLGILYISLVITAMVHADNKTFPMFSVVACVLLGVLLGVFLSYLLRNRDLHQYLNKKNGFIALLPLIPEKFNFFRYGFFWFQVVLEGYGFLRKSTGNLILDLSLFLLIVSLLYVLIVPIKVNQRAELGGHTT